LNEILRSGALISIINPRPVGSQQITIWPNMTNLPEK
jgi:hypothetical protein